MVVLYVLGHAGFIVKLRSQAQDILTPLSPGIYHILYIYTYFYDHIFDTINSNSSLFQALKYVPYTSTIYHILYDHIFIPSTVTPLCSKPWNPCQLLAAASLRCRTCCRIGRRGESGRGQLPGISKGPCS